MFHSRYLTRQGDRLRMERYIVIYYLVRLGYSTKLETFGLTITFFVKSIDINYFFAMN